MSALIALTWFLCLVSSTLTGRLHLTGAAGAFAGCAVLIVAFLAAVAAVQALVIPLRGVFAAAAPPTRGSLVGRVCVIRTGHVGPNFGQAELISQDGSAAVIQVRQTAEHSAETPLAHGVSAVVYDYDPATETFWVAPLEGI